MTEPSTVVKPTGSAQPRWLGIVLGLPLLLPGAICCGTSLAAPTIQTFQLSLRSGGLGPGAFVGAQNYGALAQLPGLGRVLGFTLAMAIVRLLAIAVVPPVLGLAAASVSGWLRGGLRVLFTLPMALFAPTALAAGWALALLTSRALITPGSAQSLVILVDGAVVLGIACAIGLMAYPAARRTGPEGYPGSTNWRGPAIGVWIVMAAAAIASALQTFNLPYVLTNGGPAQATTPLALEQFRLALVELRFGPGAAISTLTIALLAILGLLIGVLVAWGGFSLEHAPRTATAAPMGLAALVALGAALLGLVLWAISQAPLARALLLSLGAPERATAAFAQPGLLRNSFLPPLGVLVIQLPIAYLAALGIGALRPLGRASEWLLLPFSPWLFVTIGPLGLAVFNSLRQAHQLDTAAALLPPLWLSVPMLFVLTIFFKGAAGRWQAARAGGRSALGAFFGEVIGPSLPLALLLAVVAMLASSQDLLWPLIASVQQATINVALVKALGQLAIPREALALGIRLAVLPTFGLTFVALALLQLFYVDRLALRRSPPDAAGTAGKN